MPEDLVVKFGAPTLAGLKTGSLFTAEYGSRQALTEDLEKMNGNFRKKGLRVTALRFRDGKALIYLYRPRKLQQDLEAPAARRLLARYGYVYMDREHVHQNMCIAHLTDRLLAQQDFPHEIGLFLGYPPEDVKGFIDEGSRACKATGYWKVYGDVQEAEKLFQKYRKCTGVYFSCLERGLPFERLAVAGR